jgi:hypothetical protein
MADMNVKVVVSAVDAATGVLGRVNSEAVKLDGTAQKMTRAGSYLMGAGTALLGGLVASASSAAKVGVEMEHASIKTGVAVSTLSALKFAAQQNEVPFDVLQSGLIRLSRSAYAASTGSQQAARAYSTLGVSIRDSAGHLKTPDQLFGEIADKISGIEDPVKRAGLAMQVFGRGGASMLPLLMQGSSGIAALETKAKSLGLVMSKEGVESAKHYTQAMHEWSAVSGAAFRLIGSAALPALTNLVTKVADVVGHFVAWSKEHPRLSKGLAEVALVGSAFAVVLGGILKLASPIIAIYNAKTAALLANAAAYGKVTVEATKATIAEEAESIAGGGAGGAAGDAGRALTRAAEGAAGGAGASAVRAAVTAGEAAAPVAGPATVAAGGAAAGASGLGVWARWTRAGQEMEALRQAPAQMEAAEERAAYWTGRQASLRNVISRRTPGASARALARQAASAGGEAMSADVMIPMQLADSYIARPQGETLGGWMKRTFLTPRRPGESIIDYNRRIQAPALAPAGVGMTGGDRGVRQAGIGMASGGGYSHEVHVTVGLSPDLRRETADRIVSRGKGAVVDVIGQQAQRASMNGLQPAGG